MHYLSNREIKSKLFIPLQQNFTVKAGRAACSVRPYRWRKSDSVLYFNNRNA